MTKDQKNTLTLYIITILALLTQLVPNTNVQLFSLIALTALLIGLPILRTKTNANSLLHNHLTFVYRTLWIWSLIMTIGIAIAGYYVSQHYTREDFMTIANLLATMDLKSPEIRHFLHIAALGCAPSVIYLVLRLGRGLRLALLNQPFKNPKSII